MLFFVEHCDSHSCDTLHVKGNYLTVRLKLTEQIKKLTLIISEIDCIEIVVIWG